MLRRAASFLKVVRAGRRGPASGSVLRGPASDRANSHPAVQSPNPAAELMCPAWPRSTKSVCHRSAQPLALAIINQESLRLATTIEGNGNALLVICRWRSNLSGSAGATSNAAAILSLNLRGGEDCGQATETVGENHHRRRQLAHGVLQCLRPQINVGRMPIRLQHAGQIEASLPAALPMGGIAVVKAGDNQKILRIARFGHDSLSCPKL